MVPLQTDRRYELIVGDYQTGDGVRIANFDVTPTGTVYKTGSQIQFDISLFADMKRSSNTAVVEVYNLSKNTLGKLSTEFLTFSFAVGYADTGVKTVISGNVTETRTVRRGPDQITQLIMGEGYVDLNHRRLKSLVAPGKTKLDVIEEIRKQMPGVARGAYVGTNLNNPVLYGYPLNGSPKELLTKFARDNKLEVRVIDGALYVSDINGLISKDVSEAPRIAKDSGLVDIPYYASADSSKLDTDPRRRTGIQFKALLNPEVVPGKLIYLDTESHTIVRGDSTQSTLTGFYRVNDMRIYGDYRGNDWYMDCTCSQVTDVELA